MPSLACQIIWKRSGVAEEGPVGSKQKPYGGSHGVAKAGLSWTGDVASQSKPRGWVLSLGESVGKLLHGAEVLASAVAEVNLSEASEGEGVHLWSQSFGVSNGEWVDAGHLGAVRCMRSRLRLRLKSGWVA